MPELVPASCANIDCPEVEQFEYRVSFEDDLPPICPRCERELVELV